MTRNPELTNAAVFAELERRLEAGEIGKYLVKQNNSACCIGGHLIDICDDRLWKLVTESSFYSMWDALEAVGLDTDQAESLAEINDNDSPRAALDYLMTVLPEVGT